jgi:hypothetical protein
MNCCVVSSVVVWVSEMVEVICVVLIPSSLTLVVVVSVTDLSVLQCYLHMLRDPYRSSRKPPNPLNLHPQDMYKAPSCGLCFNLYDEKERLPKLLPSCGHTFWYF